MSPYVRTAKPLIGARYIEHTGSAHDEAELLEALKAGRSRYRFRHERQPEWGTARLD